MVIKSPEPKSSFLSMEKDLHIILNMMLKNPRLKRLLYYTTPDSLNRPNLTDDQSLELIGKNIKIVPKMYVDKTVLNYILIAFDRFTRNATNPEFRDNLIEFDIVCHHDQWTLKDFQLRPFKIAAEIDSMFSNKHLTGIGTLEFVRADIMTLTSEYAGLCLLFRAVHGEEDKKDMLNSRDEAQFQKDFKELISPQ